MITYATNNSFQTSYLQSVKYQMDKTDSKVDDYLEKDCRHENGVKLYFFHHLTHSGNTAADVLIAYLCLFSCF